MEMTNFLPCFRCWTCQSKHALSMRMCVQPQQLCCTSDLSSMSILHLAITVQAIVTCISVDFGLRRFPFPIKNGKDKGAIICSAIVSSMVAASTTPITLNPSDCHYVEGSAVFTASVPGRRHLLQQGSMTPVFQANVPPQLTASGAANLATTLSTNSQGFQVIARGL